MLVDPKSGVAYAFGEKLPSAHVNTVWAQLPRAADFVSGGSYALASTLTLSGAGVVEANWATVNVGASAAWTWGAANYPLLSSRTLKRDQALIIAAASTFGTTPDFTMAPTAALCTQAYVDTGGTNDPIGLFALTNLPDLSTLDFVDIIIDPSDSSTAAEKPKFAVVRNQAGGGGIVGIEVTDSTSGAGYQAEHTVRVTGTGGNPINETIDHSLGQSYYLRMTGESGSGSVAGLVIRNISCVFTVTKNTPG